MKGMVFVELIEMADSAFGEETVDEVLDSLDLESGGSYNAVGNYSCGELVAIVQAFSQKSGASVGELQRKFGEWMLVRFLKTYPEFFEHKRNAFDMLDAIEGEVHVEVRKLYPDAELPTFETERLTDRSMKMVYKSPRPLSDFCYGLITACLGYFDQKGRIDVANSVEDGKNVSEFTIHLV